MEARVLILKDEAGRKDKVFLYDSHGDQVALQNGRFSPLPKRVGACCCEIDGRRIEIWKQSPNTCTGQFLYLIKG